MPKSGGEQTQRELRFHLILIGFNTLSAYDLQLLPVFWFPLLGIMSTETGGGKGSTDFIACAGV